MALISGATWMFLADEHMMTELSPINYLSLLPNLTFSFWTKETIYQDLR